MSNTLRQLAFCFSAGAVGGLAKALVSWMGARYGWDAAFGVHWSGALSAAFLYPRVVWGGLWAFLFLLPLARSSLAVCGLIWALVVTLVQLLVLPLLTHAGLHFSLLPWFAALLLNCVWGLATALMLRLIE